MAFQLKLANFLVKQPEGVVQRCSVKKIFCKGLQLYSKRDSGTGWGYSEFCDLSKKTFFHKTPLVTASTQLSFMIE